MGNLITLDKAREVAEDLNIDFISFSLDDFRDGLQFEFEAQDFYGDEWALIKDELRILGKVVWQHLQQRADYYRNEAGSEEESTGEEEVIDNGEPEEPEVEPPVEEVPTEPEVPEEPTTEEPPAPNQDLPEPEVKPEVDPPEINNDLPKPEDGQ